MTKLQIIRYYCQIKLLQSNDCEIRTNFQALKQSNIGEKVSENFLKIGKLRFKI